MAAKRRTKNLDAAIVAYSLTREGIREIEDRLSVPDMTLYRELKRRGIKMRRRPPKAPQADRVCALDGCSVALATHQQKYCCVDHVNEAQRRFYKQTRAERIRRRLLSRPPRRPFGYRIEIGDDGRLVPDEREQAAISEMQKLRAVGQSLRGITVAMKRQGFDISRYIVTAVCKRALAA